MDSVIQSEFHYQEHTDTLTHKTTQASENTILKRNSELRKNDGAIKDLGAESGETWGRQVATIPLIMLYKAEKQGYDVFNRNSEHASKELHRWLQTPDGQTCLIREKM